MFEKAHFNAERQELRRNLVEMDTIYKKRTKEGVMFHTCDISTQQRDRGKKVKSLRPLRDNIVSSRPVWAT